MNAVDDQPGAQLVGGHLLLNVVGEAWQHVMRAVAKMSTHRCAGFDRRVDLLAVGVGVADGDRHALLGDVFNNVERTLLLGCQRKQADVALRGLLELLPLLHARPTNMFHRMRAARPVNPRDPWTFDMKARHRAAVGQLTARVRQVLQRAADVVVRAGDHGGQKAGDAGRTDDFDRAGDLVMRRVGRVVVDAGEAVDLDVDHAGRDPRFPVAGAGFFNADDTPRFFVNADETSCLWMTACVYH